LAASLFGASSPGHSSLGYYNPAFKIRIVNPSDSLQQPAIPGRENPQDDLLDNLYVGQRIVAQIGNRKVSGKISRIFKNTDNEGIFVNMTTKDGKTYKVDGSRISIGDSGSTGDNQARVDQERAISSPAFFAESRKASRFVQLFEEFIETRF
jgi:hypothetical protein